MHIRLSWRHIILTAVLALAACTPSSPAALPTRVPPREAGGESGGVAGLPPTWTPPAAATSAGETPSPFLTWTPAPTPTPWPTFTATRPRPTPTAVATSIRALPSPTPVPPLPTATEPAPVTGGNLLPNPSFEGGWYHINGIPELQVADQWRLTWEAGENPLDPDPWNNWVRPEARVLTADFLPPAEHDLFIWDGRQTVKIFKGQGALSFRLLTDVFLEPGTYRLEVNVFPDLVVGYTESGAKIWAPDPLSGEIRLLAGDAGTGWRLPSFGRKNTYQHTFVVTEGRTLAIGIAARGRWAIENNGWFFDDWSLRRVAGG